MPQENKFDFLWVLFLSDGILSVWECEMDRRFGAASAVMQVLHWTAVKKKEMSQKAKLTIYPSIYISTHNYGHELWVVTEK